MATTKKYEVRLFDCNLSEDRFSFVMTDMMNAKPTTVEASSLDDLGRQVRGLASGYGRDCGVSIMLPKGQRKPPGFDKFKSGLQYVKVETVSA